VFTGAASTLIWIKRQPVFATVEQILLVHANATVSLYACIQLPKWPSATRAAVFRQRGATPPPPA